VSSVRLKLILTLAALGALAGAGAAIANHVPQVDPATVPTGMLAEHNSIADVPVSPFARAVNPDGADVFVQHVRLPANAASGWHTHPGPALVTVVSGSLTYEDALANECRDRTYGPGTGFVDRGFGHVHRAIAGSDGADFYITYVLPPGSATHVIPVTSAPEPCA
jgi:quercetin dioxygenase-like cupin family protein